MVESDIADVLKDIGGVGNCGIRRSFFGLGFNVEDFRVGFKWNILLKGGYELGFEGIKG